MSQKVFTGIGVSEGIRIGTAYIFEHIQSADISRNIIAEDVGTELLRLKDAIQKASAEVEELISRSLKTLGKDEIGVLKGQKSILSDPAYCPEIEKLVSNKLYSPEKSVVQVTEKFAAVFENMKNDYMKERAADIRDAGNRLLKILSGIDGGIIEQSSPVILVADDLSPSDTIQLDKQNILAFVTQKGGKTSHTSIFAKSMGIPAVVNVPGLLASASKGNTVILDGAQGVCIIDPDPETVDEYQAKMESEIREQEMLDKYSKQNALTRDGKRIVVAANIGSAADAEYSLAQGAEAAGLMRTEQIYLSRNTIPDEDEQFAIYKKIAETYSQKEVIIRTLDIGGDKAINYLEISKEQNPFLGFRAIRFCLERKDVFLTQLRAILRASAFGKLAVMFPMISGYDELLLAKSVLSEAKEQLKAADIAFDEDIRAGIMIEVPSAALIADKLAEEADFFSIGTNDLVQYTLAVDRGNEKVSYLYDYFNPAVIKLIQSVSNAAHARGIPVGMCGGMAGDPLAVPILLGLRLDELSMSAGSIAKTKYILGKLNSKECENLAVSALECRTAKDIRRLLNEFYQSHIG